MDGENRLNVWLRRMNDDRRHGGTGAAGGSANGWVLRDTISLHETCGHLVEQGWETAGDGDEDAPAVTVVGAGDNAGTTEKDLQFSKPNLISLGNKASRLFPLWKMTAFGQQQSLQAVDSLVSDGGTNIIEGLRKAARMVDDRQARNLVCSIILLSDGVDSYNLLPRDGSALDYAPLVPRSILPGSEHYVPIHAFGFGMDHDSTAMHAVAQMSSGTFSLIDVVGSIQDAFASCIGASSACYASGVDGDCCGAFMHVGRLYASEERDFLVTVCVPPSRVSVALIRPSCTYRDTVTTEKVRVGGDPVMLLRPEFLVSAGMSLQVEREWHRVHATEDMAAEQAAVEEGDYTSAASGVVRVAVLGQANAGASG
ncbi:unnamed protein product [Miscanthus lutarioriparius]|uniref:VWFA domain-containing protein n=1 Tax=Miscanthus lutarioriparius TaxID=422564 RepID=A0A811NFV1_9POAL|nr:unnamed protein product [Miscanthus lutarioriparius]